MKSFPNINKQEQNNISVFIPLKPKNRAMNLQQYFALSTQLSIPSLVNKAPTTYLGCYGSHPPFVISFVIMASPLS